MTVWWFYTNSAKLYLYRRRLYWFIFTGKNAWPQLTFLRHVKLLLDIVQCPMTIWIHPWNHHQDFYGPFWLLWNCIFHVYFDSTLYDAKPDCTCPQPLLFHWIYLFKKPCILIIYYIQINLRFRKHFHPFFTSYSFKNQNYMELLEQCSIH